MLKFFRIPFAQSGDRAPIPDAADVNGFVSYTEGYGFDYQRQKDDPASKNIERDKMNQAFFDMTGEVGLLQQHGIPDFITTALNGGTAFEYSVGAVVRYDAGSGFRNYVSLVDNNDQLPSVDTHWQIVRNGMPATTATGTGNAIEASFTPALVGLRTGDVVLVKAAAANTGATTLAIEGGAAINVLKASGAPLTSGDIPNAGAWAMFLYDAAGPTFQLINPAAASAGGDVGDVKWTARLTAPTGWLVCDGTAVSRSTYAALFAELVTNAGFTAQTFTVTIASPATFTKAAHGLYDGNRVRLSTTGALPTGLTTGVDYYVLRIDANTFRLSLTLGGAAINTTGGQSGTHSYLQSLWGLGDGSTTFNKPNLVDQFIRGASGTRPVGSGALDAFQGHYHTVTMLAGTGSANGFGGTTGNANFSVSSPYGATTIGPDGVNGTPRVASETRPMHVVMLPVIKF